MNPLRRRPGARLLSATTALLVATGAALVALQPVATSATTPDDDAATLLPEPALGRAAVRSLESRPGALRAAARVNGRTPAALRELLGNDPAFGLDRAGRLLVADEFDGELHPGRHPGSRSRSAASASALVAATPDDVLDLHSRPGSRRTIFIDIDGHELRGTWWNDNAGAPEQHYGGWDPAGNGSSLSTSERRMLHEIWARVAEDYAHYDVNVTTADPGTAALERSGNADDVFGMRALLSDSPVLADSLAGSGSSTIGMAYLGIFDKTLGAPQPPALVFSARIGPDAAVLADTVTHEVGHTLALEHVEGPRTSLTHPIMYYRVGSAPMSVWTASDLAVIPSSGLAVKPDEVGTSTTTAPVSTSGTAGGTISSGADADWFRFDGCTSLVANATVATYGPNLDLRLSLRDAAGAEIAADAPATVVDQQTGGVSGLGASLSRSLSGGTHYLVVTGAGSGAGGVPGEYDNTASLGDYRLDVTGCSVQATAPGQPTDASAVTTADGTTTLTWGPPATSGGSPVTGYVVKLGSAAPVTVSAGARSHSAVTGAGARVTASVSAVNASGTSSAATVSSLLPPPAPVHVGMEHYDETTWLPVVVQQTEDLGTHLEIRAGNLTWNPILIARPTRLYKDDLALGTVFEARVTNVAGASPWTNFTVGAPAPPTPTPGPWPTPSPTPSPEPTVVPTPEPTDSPTPSPSPTSAPTTTPTPGPTAGPTTSPTTVPTTGPTPGPVPTPKVRPGKPRKVSAARGPRGGKKTIRVRWRAPKVSGSHRVTTYRVVLRKVNARGKVVGKARVIKVKTRKGRVTRQVRLGKGRWKVRVRARSAAGWSKWSRWTKPVRAR